MPEEDKIITESEINLLDYLFGEESIQIEKDRNYSELGSIFEEDL